MSEQPTWGQIIKDRFINRSNAPTYKARTTTWATIAVFGMLVYVLWIIQGGAKFQENAVVETFVDGRMTKRVTGTVADQDFVDLLSDVALIIAASFSTVIGYYFGNRNAENQAHEVTSDAQKTLDEVTKQRDQLTADLETLRNSKASDGN